MKTKVVLFAMSSFRILVLLIPILLMPITSEAKQKVTVGGKTVVVDSIRVVEDQFEITYNGRVLKGRGQSQLSAVIAEIAIQEQENNRNQEVSKPKKKKRSKQANKTNSKALKPTDIKIDIKYDEFEKCTEYKSPYYRTITTYGHPSNDFIFLRAYKYDQPNRIKYQIYIHSVYCTGKYIFYEYAHDIDGNSLELRRIVMDHAVGGCCLYEDVVVVVSENYLQERKDRGLKLKISGQSGEHVFSLPAEYISAFLRAIERHANCFIDSRFKKAKDEGYGAVLAATYAASSVNMNMFDSRFKKARDEGYGAVLAAIYAASN